MMLTFQPLITQRQQWEYLRKPGFTPDQIRRFIAYRAFYKSGFYQTDPTTFRRLFFARWLYLEGKIGK